MVKSKMTHIIISLCLLLTLMTSCSSTSGKEKEDLPSGSVETSADTSVTTPVVANFDASATDFVKNIKIGWNLGNTLDATGGKGLTSEMSWGNPATTKEMIDMVKDAGFNIIRIPVSWGNHLDSEGKIDEEWMNRVQQVVDYAIEDNMYVILNAHHEGSWLSPLPEKEKEVTEKLVSIWEQIAARFKDYNEYLIFEGLNEPRTEGSPKEWQGGTPEERAVINNLIQAFVDTVRGTGGYNAERYLMVTQYAASSSRAALSDLKVPDDKHVIVSVHAYSPYNMSLNRKSDVKALDANGENEITGMLKNLKELFIDNGIPVILGEFGFLNKDNETERAAAVKFYIEEAKKIGIPCVWWDNGTNCSPLQGEGFGILDRRNLSWYYEEIKNAIIEASK